MSDTTADPSPAVLDRMPVDPPLKVLRDAAEHFRSDALRFDQSSSVLCEGIGDAMRGHAITLDAIADALDALTAADAGCGKEYDAKPNPRPCVRGDLCDDCEIERDAAITTLTRGSQ